eukprot:1160984-Pelagomonas_calceolata.AAC.5
MESRQTQTLQLCLFKVAAWPSSFCGNKQKLELQVLQVETVVQHPLYAARAFPAFGADVEQAWYHQEKVDTLVMWALKSIRGKGVAARAVAAAQMIRKQTLTAQPHRSMHAQPGTQGRGYPANTVH